MGYAAMPRRDADLVAPVRTVNAEGGGPFAIVCDHASNRFPPAYGDLGLPAADFARHVAYGGTAPAQTESAKQAIATTQMTPQEQDMAACDASAAACFASEDY